jgi:hypothetical protein
LARERLGANARHLTGTTQPLQLTRSGQPCPLPLVDRWGRGTTRERRSRQ